MYRIYVAVIAVQPCSRRQNAKKGAKKGRLAVAEGGKRVRIPESPIIKTGIWLVYSALACNGSDKVHEVVGVALGIEGLQDLVEGHGTQRVLNRCIKRCVDG